jgi:drug/metabolite transporter (DMT)-like permease
MDNGGGKVNPALALIFGVLMVSTASILIRFAQQEASSLVIAAYRLGLATLILAPLVGWRYRGDVRRLTRKDLGLASLSGILLALHFAIWTSSLEYTSVASSVVLVTTTPIWVGLLAPFMLKETMRRQVKVGLVLALMGGFIVGASDACSWSADGLVCPNALGLVSGRAFLGDLMALVGAWMAAGYVLIGRRLRGRMSLVSYVFVVYGMASVVLLAIVLAAGLPLGGYQPVTYLWFVLLAIFPQLLGHTTFNWALRYLSAGYVAVALLGEPVGSTILAYLLLAETPSLMKLCGAAVILSGIYLASRGERSGK